MPSSSSSDEEDLSKFREAADCSLYSDSLFLRKQAPKKEKPPSIIPPSLRNIDGEDHDRIHNEVKVSPAFQTHVAKKLSQLLDSQLDISDKSTDKSNAAQNTRCILKAKRAKDLAGSTAESNGGVRLFGASAVFLSNMNIVPAPPPRRRKRDRKVAFMYRGSESSSEDSDSDNMLKLSAAAVSPDWILSGTATKGWANKQSKVETGFFAKSAHQDWVKQQTSVSSSSDLAHIKDDVSRGYESLNEISCSNNNSKEVLNYGAKDDLTFLKHHKHKKSTHPESDLAASLSSIVSIGSDSQADTSIKSKKKCKKKKRKKKEQHSEDATTETTEVEDIIDERRKKVKKGKKKKSKRLKIEEEEEMGDLEIIKPPVPSPMTDGNDKEYKSNHKKKRKRKEKKSQKESYFKESKSRKVIRKHPCKKKLKKIVSHLSEDLAKLMVNSSDTPPS